MQQSFLGFRKEVQRTRKLAAATAIGLPDISTTSSDTVDLERQLAEAETKRQALEESSSDLTREVEQLREANAELEARLRNAPSEVQQGVNSALAATIPEVEDLTPQLKEAETKIAELESAGEELRQTIENLTAELGASRLEKEVLSETSEKLSTKLSESNSKSQELEAELNVARLRIEETEKVNAEVSMSSTHQQPASEYFASYRFTNALMVLFKKSRLSKRGWLTFKNTKFPILRPRCKRSETS